MEAELPEEVKKRALLLILSALTVTILIGAALPRLQFQPGMPLPSLANGQVVLEPTEAAPPVGASLNKFFEILVLMIVVVFLIILVYRMIKGVDWKRLLSDLFSFLFTLFVLCGFLFVLLSLLPKSQGLTEAVPLPIPEPIVRAPLGPVPPLLIWLVGLGLFGAVILLGIWIVGSKRRSELDGWELGAENARLALLAGGDLRDVILRCYQQMSRALRQEREIEREAYMTTGEFERLLTTKGIPYDPVHQLTQLFEAVRYGGWQPNSLDEQRALRSLDAILEYSRGSGQEG